MKALVQTQEKILISTRPNSDICSSFRKWLRPRTFSLLSFHERRWFNFFSIYAVQNNRTFFPSWFIYVSLFLSLLKHNYLPLFNIFQISFSLFTCYSCFSCFFIMFSLFFTFCQIVYLHPKYCMMNLSHHRLREKATKNI